jgi:RNA polymerase sigma-70 factor (ECF subfamily)
MCIKVRNTLKTKGKSFMTRLLDKITAGKISNGDSLSFETLIRAYKDKVFNYCYHFCNDYHHAEELTQEIFIKVYRNIKHYDCRKSSLSTWIYTITHNECINSIRTNAHETLYEEVIPESYTTEDDYLKQELLNQLNMAIHSLTPQERSLILMKDYYGLKLKEISKVMDLPVGTLKSRLHNTRWKIRTMIGDLDD